MASEGKRSLDKTKMNKTMNDIVKNELGGKSGISVPTTPVMDVPLTKLLDFNGREISKDPVDLKSIPAVKSVLDYNKSVLEIEKEYSSDTIEILDGTILVRLFKKIPIRNGLHIGFNSLVLGAKQLKMSSVEDPLHFNNIGVIVNMDASYEARNEQYPGSWKLKVGDIVQVKEVEALTFIEQQGGSLAPPYLKNMFFKYDDKRRINESGYIGITSREIKCKLPNFDLEDYQEREFKTNN
jgi:hypothetical protein